ncbi:MAG: hypothetical protein M1817_002476 [Caeruleum heppii]|nr:MAG: hypothetical protein M1817_002476 [Caeruleum heppii]
MPLRDILKKKDRLDSVSGEPDGKATTPPEFTFLRSDTHTQEIISPPTFPAASPLSAGPVSPSQRPSSRFRSASNASIASVASLKSEKRLSQRLHLRSHSRQSSASSIHVPQDLPDIGAEVGDKDDAEAKWEQRATLLASSSRPGTGHGDASADGISQLSINGATPSREKGGRRRSVSAPKDDENIQEAIRLHETGDLPQATAMFGRLADPEGADNALSQVLYGLSLRHGWGCQPDPAKAVVYLSMAAQSSAAVEQLALQAGMKKGGAAKGELVLAIYELANCFRHGWGVASDPVAAKQYYETAANLGDTDAMNEVAWCYLEGYGTKKDKVSDWTYDAILGLNIVGPLSMPLQPLSS